jgi:uncharacterized membrane protein
MSWIVIGLLAVVAVIVFAGLCIVFAPWISGGGR